MLDSPGAYYKLISFPFVVAFALVNNLQAFTFVSAGERNPNDTIVHAIGYRGKGELLEISVGLHPDYAYLEDEIEFSATQAVSIWNNLIPTTGNLTPSAEIPKNGGVDVMGVLIHELGHTLGLAHPNQGGNFRNAAKSTKGPNGKFEYSGGIDGIAGTADDRRGDDENLNYFDVMSNNPFFLRDSGAIDSLTYSQDLSRLPGNETFPAIGNRNVAQKIYGLENSMAIMVGGGSQIPGLVRRSLSADDVAGIRFAMSGLDEIAGTADDYTYRLYYTGVDENADVVIKFDKPDGNASAGILLKRLTNWRHRVMTPGRPVRYNPYLSNDRTWYFPMLDSKRFQIVNKTDHAAQLRIKTLRGRRYAISLISESGVPLLPDRGISASAHGREISVTGADYFFFIARSKETSVELNSREPFPTNSSIVVFEVYGKPLNIN